MITGVVNAALEARIPIEVQAPAGGDMRQTEAVVDTGFGGYLTLPSALIASLGLPWLCRQNGVLADGSIQVFDVYTATVIWDGGPRTVEVEAIDVDPLVGMSLLHGFELRVRVVPGGAVHITAAP